MTVLVRRSRRLSASELRTRIQRLETLLSGPLVKWMEGTVGADNRAGSERVLASYRRDLRLLLKRAAFSVEPC